MAHEQSHKPKPVLEHIGKGQLRGFAAFGVVLGLIQVAVQWVCLIIQYVCPMPPRAEYDTDFSTV
jgi:hypothetical protein